MKVDLAIVARDLKLPPEKIEKTVELLDEGNTIPFITRFRKDLTGGLDEQQILSIKDRVSSLRALSERKAFVVKSIDSQGKLTDELKAEIGKATSSRRLEDLYLPFKPKKQSRAMVARQQGLEPLANDIFNGVSPDADLATLATNYVRVDKGLNSVDDVFNGVRDLLAERFGESDELRSSLRRIMWNDGKLASQLIATPEVEAANEGSDPSAASPDAKNDAAETPPSVSVKKESLPRKSENDPAATPLSEVKAAAPEATATPSACEAEASTAAIDQITEGTTAPSSDSTETVEEPSAVASVEMPIAEKTIEATTNESNDAPATAGITSGSADTPTVQETKTVEAPTIPESAVTPDATAAPDSTAPAAEPAVAPEPAAAPETVVASETAIATETAKSPESAVAQAVEGQPKKKKKKKKKKKVEDPFKDFHDFSQALKQLPHHRVLAINRGERAGKLKVKVDIDPKKIKDPTMAALVPAEHPFKEFMQKCANEALTRAIVPSLEREIRRELTEAAEKHAVEVFANNLRNLLLQPPVRNRTVMAIDPGFKRGCSVAVVDPCGDVLDSGHIFVVGNQTRRDEGKQKLVDWIKNNRASVIAIGNGAACRQTEQLVSDIISEHFASGEIRYVMVNEAGASVYSTSEIGREELPDAAPSIRSAISIARRLQDPLSELVKIAPANIGVGMYQHDVKAKHLSDSLDNVVEFCVNQVGVNVNTASPSLLKYVSGLNALTARRLVEYRQENGKFKNREELKKVSGVGDATFVQAAGFLRIHGGDTPLDSTSIHPESYLIADDVLTRANTSLAELFVKPSVPEASPVPAVVKPEEVEAKAAEEISDVAPASAADPQAAEAPQAVPDMTKAAAAPEAPAAVQPETPAATEAPAVVEAVTTAATESTAENNAATQTETKAPSSPTTESVTVAPAVGANTEAVPTQDPAVAATSQLDLAKRKEVLKRMSELDIDQVSTDHSAGRLLVKDILMSLKRPDWDPRGKSKKLIFRSGIIKADDLKPEMQLDGQVVNVVDFGVFVDIGLGESSLVHVSQLSNHFVRDPHQLFAVGDVLRVWVSEIDTERRRVKLTAVRPGSKKPPARRKRKYEGKGEPKPAGTQRSTSESSGNRSGRFENKYKGKGKTGERSYSKGTSYQNRSPRRSKPKPVKPITEGMLKGKEPMRSFSDLAQFVKKTPETKTEDKDQPKKKS